MMLVLLYFLTFLIIFSLTVNAFISPTFIGYSCSTTMSFTINGTYQSNLNLLFSSLSNSTFRNGFSNVFYNTTVGQAPDEVYGLFLCRGDLNSTTCRDCVSSATRDVTRYCPLQKISIMWYDECHLRYSDQSFFSIGAQNPAIWRPSTENVTEPEKFDDTVFSLMDKAANKAASKVDKFATVKTENFRKNQTLYGLVQCTQDLSSRDCFSCLRAANSQLPVCCGGRKGGRVLTPSCNSRFELYSFFNETFTETIEPAPTPTPTPPAPGSVTGSKGGKGRQVIWIAIGTTLSGIVVLVLSAYLLRCIWRKYKEEKTKRRALQLLRSGDNEHNISRGKHEVESHQDLPIFPLGQILEATRHFSDENKLGEGGFGPVYKGVLTDGKEIAAKRLSRTSGQGLQEFKNEVTLIAKLQHKNLVRLLGCCLEEKEFLLIYEYLPNNSLNLHLFDSVRGKELDWKRRMIIINGIARGLLYLHEDSRLKIIHRDLKTSNILLDHDMNPKISDFGMARIFGGNQNEANTNRVVGTYGYMAPEYAMQGIFSVKSDVFSFGVLLLEIISGRKNTRFHLSEYGQSLLTYAWDQWCEGQALELMDPAMVESCVPTELLKFIHIGLLCVQEDPTDRPTMSSVVVMLANDTITLPKPTQPAFSVGRFVAKSDQSSSTSKGCSVNEVTLSNVIPR